MSDLQKELRGFGSETSIKTILVLLLISIAMASVARAEVFLEVNPPEALFFPGGQFSGLYACTLFSQDRKNSWRRLCHRDGTLATAEEGTLYYSDLKRYDRATYDSMARKNPTIEERTARLHSTFWVQQAGGHPINYSNAPTTVYGALASYPPFVTTFPNGYTNYPSTKNSYVVKVIPTIPQTRPEETPPEEHRNVVSMDDTDADRGRAGRYDGVLDLSNETFEAGLSRQEGSFLRSRPR